MMTPRKLLANLTVVLLCGNRWLRGTFRLFCSPAPHLYVSHDGISHALLYLTTLSSNLLLGSDSRCCKATVLSCCTVAPVDKNSMHVPLHTYGGVSVHRCFCLWTMHLQTEACGQVLFLFSSILNVIAIFPTRTLTWASFPEL